MTSDRRAAVVTGASRGIGRAIAIRLASDGIDVVVHYGHDPAAAATVVAAIERLGRRALAIQADVARPNEIRAMFVDGGASI